MQVGVVQSAEVADKQEIIAQLQRLGLQPVEFLWQQAAPKLAEMAGYIVLNGALDAATDSLKILKQQSDQGKPILGIGQGAQILVASGLVPGLENNKVAMRLTEAQPVTPQAGINLRLAKDYQRNAFTKYLSSKAILQLPATEFSARFDMPPALALEIVHQGLNVLQYCNEKGELIDYFPPNAEGAVSNAAAIANKAGNIMALVPHPAHLDVGDAIFASMRDYMAAGHFTPVQPLGYYPRGTAVPAKKARDPLK